MQAPPEVCEHVESLESLQHARSCGRILEGADVVVYIAFVLQITRKAWRPERLARHPLDQTLKNGVPLTSRIRNNATPIEIDHSNTHFWDTSSEATPHDLCEARKLFGSRCEEVNESAFVNRDQACFIVGLCYRVRPFERSKKGVQDGLVRPIAFILATVVVAEKPTAAHGKATAVWQGIIHDCVFVAGSCCKLLQECGLPVTCIPRDEHQPEFTGQHCWDKLTVKCRFYVQLLAQGIETTGTAITALTLTVERQEIRHVWVCIR